VSALGRASGKVILLGEHAVVYGAPALAAGIERGARAEATRTGDGEPSRLALGGAVVSAVSGEDVARAFAALLAEGDPLPPLSVTAAIDLPTGAGLGSSAAIGVAIARAALSAAGRPVEEASVIARATAWERIFHGNPSGIDVTAAAVGGCFRFTRADGIRPVVPARDLTLCVGLSGVSTSTRVMVEALARLRAEQPALVDGSIARITALVSGAATAIEAGDLHALGARMDDNQALLAGLRLSTEALEDLCARARAAGALGAKLTGKGGGGSVLALAGDGARAAAVLAAWSAAGYEGFVTRVAARTTS
jgi:mevalonate kinase